MFAKHPEWHICADTNTHFLFHSKEVGGGLEVKHSVWRRLQQVDLSRKGNLTCQCAVEKSTLQSTHETCDGCDITLPLLVFSRRLTCATSGRLRGVATFSHRPT